MTTHTLTGDLGDLVGDPHPEFVAARLELVNAPYAVEAGEVRFPVTRLDLADDGTFTQAGVPGWSPAGVPYQYQVAAEYAPNEPGMGNEFVTVGPFELAADADLADLAGPVGEWPPPYDATVAAIRPTLAALATLTVNLAAPVSATNFHTLADAATQATALQVAAVQQTSVNLEFSALGTPYGPDYRVDIVISPGTHAGGAGLGQWVCLVGATGNPDDVVITSSTTGNGTIHSFGPVYLEGITVRSTGAGTVPSGPKYPWHITNGSRGCSIAANCKFLETNTGGEGAVGMDGGEGTTALLYACTLTGISPSAVANLHGAVGNNVPVTTMVVGCTLNGNVGYAELGNVTDEFWFISNTGGSVGTLSGSVNSHTTGTWPLPNHLLSPFDEAYFLPGILVGDVQTFGTADQASFSPPVGRTYYVKVTPTRAIHTTHAGVVGAAAGGVCNVRRFRSGTPPTHTPGANTGTIAIGANDVQSNFYDTYYPGEAGHLWVQVGTTSGTPSLQGSIVMGNAAGSYYSDDGGTTKFIVPGGTRVPVVRLYSAT